MPSTFEYILTKDGLVTAGIKKEFSVPGSLSPAEITTGGPADLWDTTLSLAEAQDPALGVWGQRGGTSDDIKGRTIDKVWMKIHYTVPVVGDPPVTSIAQTRYLPGFSTRNGPMSLRRG